MQCNFSSRTPTCICSVPAHVDILTPSFINIEITARINGNILLTIANSLSLLPPPPPLEMVQMG